MATARKKLPPIHPGEILREDLREIGISLNQLARDTWRRQKSTEAGAQIFVRFS